MHAPTFQNLFGVGIEFYQFTRCGQAACIQHKTELSRGTPVTVTSPDASAVSFQTSDKTKTIATLISSLLSDKESVRTGPKQQLIELAESSSETRQIVIQGLLEHRKTLNQLDGTHTVLAPEIFGYWSSVTEIFWQLKAAEAIDTMIQCIHCSNGYTGRMANHQHFTR